MERPAQAQHAMPEGGKNRVRIDLDRFGEARAVVEVSPAEIRLFVCDDVMVSGRSFERIIGLDVTEYAHAHDRLAQANHLLELAGQELQARIEEVKKLPTMRPICACAPAFTM